ncbi:MAG: putative toxin-antitoxin system toxin component, PIN family [Betaproteobacteria bacterium]|nr:putative toxin-antitoxin system toxin component, PIN family [Betaproteobacteria bacterium]
MRAVADTNTVVSGLLWRGAPRQFLDAARAGQFSLYTSAPLLVELAEVFPRRKFSRRVLAANISVERLVRRYARLAQRIAPAEINPTVLLDPDDDAVLACALGARADLLVSGDKHLRNLKIYQGIQIVTVAEALATLPRRT